MYVCVFVCVVVFVIVFMCVLVVVLVCLCLWLIVVVVVGGDWICFDVSLMCVFVFLCR